MKKFIFSPALLFVFILLTSFRFFSMPGYQVGDSVKDFKLKSVKGNMVSLADYTTAKGIIVVFTCNHCPFSQAYENRIIDLHKKYAAMGYPVVAINPNDKDIVPEDSYEEMVKRAKQYKYPFDYIYDESQEVAQAFGAARTPHVFLLKKEKSDYVIKYIGAIDDNADEPTSATKHYVEDAIAALNKGQDPAVASTKAIGCTIKWKQKN